MAVIEPSITCTPLGDPEGGVGVGAGAATVGPGCAVAVGDEGVSILLQPANPIVAIARLAKAIPILTISTSRWRPALAGSISGFWRARSLPDLETYESGSAGVHQTTTH